MKRLNEAIGWSIGTGFVAALHIYAFLAKKRPFKLDLDPDGPLW